MDNVERISISGLVMVMVVSVAAATQLSGQAANQLNGDFRSASVAELHDAQGTVLLRGNFAAAETDDKGEVERKATLTPAAGGTAKGEAEVEFQAGKPELQEVEISASGLAPGSDVVFVIDGNKVATLKVDAKGKAAVEFETRAK